MPESPVLLAVVAGGRRLRAVEGPTRVTQGGSVVLFFLFFREKKEQVFPALFPSLPGVRNFSEQAK